MTVWIKTYKSPDKLVLLAQTKGYLCVNIHPSITYSLLPSDACFSNSSHPAKADVHTIRAEGGDCPDKSLLTNADHRVRLNPDCKSVGSTKLDVRDNVTASTPLPPTLSNETDLNVGAIIRFNISNTTLLIANATENAHSITPGKYDSEICVREKTSCEIVLTILADEKRQRAKTYRLH